MRRIQAGTRRGRTPFRRTGVWVLLATTGVVTAIWAAEIAAKPDDPDDLARTLRQQKAQSGELVKPEPGTDEHQATPLTSEQSLALVDTYEKEMHQIVEHAENTRIAAYRTKDIIRMTCIDDKLTQMKTVLNIVEPRLIRIRMVQHDELVFRGQFSLIQQARDRMKQLANEIDICTGDVLDAVSVGKIQEEVPPVNEADPTRPQNPGTTVERPPEASSYQ